MKVITKDPSSCIPNIMESDLKNNVLIVRLESEIIESNEYIGYIFKEIDKVCCGGGRNIVGGKYITWFRGVMNLITLLINIWKLRYDTMIYCLESKEDFINIKSLIYNPVVLSRIELEIKSKFGGDDP